MASGNTMELNSILEEARKRKGASAQRPAAASPAVRKQVRSFEDDFVLTDDDDSYVEIRPTGRTASTPRPTNKPVAYMAPAKKAPKKNKTGLIVTLSIVGVVLLAAIGGLTLFLNLGLNGSNEKLADNIYVNGTSIGGMTVEQARQTLADVEKNLAAGIKVDIKADEKTYSVTGDQLGCSFNTEDILAQAKAYSDGKGLKNEKQEYELKVIVSDESCESVIGEIAEQAKSEAKNATVTAFDPSASSMFTIEDEVKGLAVNEEETLAALKAFFSNGNMTGTVEAPVETVDPKYTAAYLKDNIRKLSSYQTYSVNNSNGNSNMKVSLAACNGSVIEPGATWSFNNCTGDSNLESNGYLPAGVIIQGRSEVGVGGGICQSSTTIYNAAIRCGMKVEERACHYYKSAYVDAGLDATIDYGNIDLKVSNPFDYQLFIKCWMDGTELNAEIYGLPNPDFDDISISTTDPTYFSNGFTVYTSRTYYKNGSEVRTEDLPSSTYYTSAPSSDSSSPDAGSVYTGDDSSSKPEPGGSSEVTPTPDPDPDPGNDPDPDPGNEPDPDPTPDPDPGYDPGTGEDTGE